VSSFSAGIYLFIYFYFLSWDIYLFLSPFLAITTKKNSKPPPKKKRKKNEKEKRKK
jgi:hypothetical protein